MLSIVWQVLFQNQKTSDGIQSHIFSQKYARRLELFILSAFTIN
jgi:hypothetical protein